MYVMFKAWDQDFPLITHLLYVSTVTGPWQHTGLGGGHVVHILECSAFPSQIWQKVPGIDAQHRWKNQDSKQSQPVELKTAFVKVYRMDKTAHLQYIAACEQVRLSYRDTSQSHEKQAAQKRKERRTKSILKTNKLYMALLTRVLILLPQHQRPANVNSLLLLRMSFNPNQKNSGTPQS